MTLQETIRAMEQALTEEGFLGLKTPRMVQDHMKACPGLTLLFVNSLCGCAGIGARLGTKMALEQSTYPPHHLITVFAGVDEEATEEIFKYAKPYPPSSPSIALFKDGELVHFIERHQLKGVDPVVIAKEVQQALYTHRVVEALA